MLMLRPPIILEKRAVRSQGELHPTAACPDCGGRMFWHVAPGRTPFWGCVSFPACRGSRSASGPNGEPDERERAPKGERAEIDFQLRTLVRDELASREDVLMEIAQAVGRRCHVATLRSDEAPVALAAVLALRERLERQANPHMPVRPRAPETCCQTVRDAYGAMTICRARLRWCLGVAEHATRGEHTAATEGVTWGTAEHEDELVEDAQAAFVIADSRRTS